MMTQTGASATRAAAVEFKPAKRPLLDLFTAKEKVADDFSALRASGIPIIAAGLNDQTGKVVVGITTPPTAAIQKRFDDAYGADLIELRHSEQPR